MNNELSSKYFEWIYQLVCKDKSKKGLSYRKLLTCLNNTEFVYTVKMDENRASDGVDLRNRFGYENNYSTEEILECFDDKNCSVLEMMVGLSIRIEEHIMCDPDIGDRTAQWFWNMIENLGLNGMSDDNFNSYYTNHVLQTFMNRTYEKNGKGGLFRNDRIQYDFRKEEIWKQMCRFFE